ncbi:MAG: EboA domain-containing protein [Hyphomicrobium sp.]|uniref:EboA domain-containing protein n=1 Tax=Hyphomicrobium sp. TaxID=82 RepID=UPI001326E3D3|nr:EboA domain-containing protein [Hyphomicrobium sp.]KAB2942020.1 MAG: hypothetical protein F9K20_08035 [Hyphomicrobium sp.]MBZ0210537.1 EboA domain-containing protein [Hyphomicrobium sp.]
MTSSTDDVLRRIELLRDWLKRRLDAEQLDWVDEQCARIAEAPTGKALTLAIGLAPRRVGKEQLRLDAAEAAGAEHLRPGLSPDDWTVDQVTRILFVLASYAGAEDTFAARLDGLVRSGEISEQIALLRGLPLYPAPEQVLPTASEGVRSAMQPVFEAVAHKSPYPAEQFSEAMWNQLVVKALFVGSRLAPIQGLDARRNADLARMLVDYAHERWAAGRTVSPELWRCVGPFAGDNYLDELIRVFESPLEIERQAAALALSECPTPDALVILESTPTLWRDIRSGRLTWETLG